MHTHTETHIHTHTHRDRQTDRQTERNFKETLVPLPLGLSIKTNVEKLEFPQESSHAGRRKRQMPGPARGEPVSWKEVSHSSDN